MMHVATDIGSVLCKVDFTDFLNQLSETTNCTVEEATYFLHRSQKMQDLGITTMEEDLKTHFKINSNTVSQRLLSSWMTSIQPDYTVLEMYSRLVDLYGVKFALLSNMGIEHSTQINRLLDYNDFFAKCVPHFSCQVGARKPTSIFFQSFLMDHPEFKECLYVDDLIDNLATAKKYGFQGYHFSIDAKNSIGSIEELERLIYTLRTSKDKENLNG
jgi:FMN phosphatase YigB (HAD superfamily)